MGRTDEVARLFSEMEDREEVAVDLPAINAYVDAVAKSGRLAEAEAMLTRAMAMAREAGLSVRPSSAWLSVRRLSVYQAIRPLVCQWVSFAVWPLLEVHAQP
jgi:hypothetical protein